MDCIFCKITKGELESDIIWQDNDVLVFNDINPKAPVHILIMPKRHIASIKEIEEKDRDVVSKLIYTAKNIARDKKLEGYKLVFNVGREGGQVIDHLHLHLLGGWGGKDAPGEADI